MIAVIEQHAIRTPLLYFAPGLEAAKKPTTAENGHGDR